MNRKQIVLQTIGTQSIQRSFAVDYMPSFQTHRALLKYFDLPENQVGEKELLDILGSDLYYLSARDISQREGYHSIWKHTPQLSDDERTCAFGIKWKRVVGKAKFSVDESIYAPLADCTDRREILNYPWPRAKDFDFDLLLEESERNSDRAIVGGMWTGILGDAYRLVGFQHFLLMMAMDPQFVHTLVQTLTDVYLELNDAYFTSLSQHMDIWFFGNDFGTQHGLLCSPEMWRSFFFDPITKLCDLAHSHNLAVMMHSCGAIAPIIPDLIAAGVDILDPIQITAEGMSADKLISSYKDKITFHGGIDTQRVLPFGTVKDIRCHTENIIQTLGAYGKYIVAGSQILGPDIPLENILALYEEIARLKTALQCILCIP